MNLLYISLPLAAVLANLILGMFILYRDPRNRLNILYSLFTLTLAVWALTDFFVLTSLTPEAAFQWNSFGVIGSSLMPVLILHFFLAFSKSGFAKKKMYYISMYLPALLFMFINFMISPITEHLTSSAWGYTPVTGDLYNMFSFYATAYVIAGLLICFNFYLKTTSARKKTQAKFLMIAISVPAFGGIVTQVIPAMIGLETIRLTTTLTTVMAVIIAYTIIRYQLMAPVSFSIRNKMMALLLIISIIPISVTGFLFIETAQFDLKEQMQNHLETAVRSRAHHIETMITENKYVAESASKSRIYMDVLKDPDDYLLWQKANGMILGILKTRPEILRIDILDKNGVIIVSSDASVLGTDESETLSVLETEGFFIRDAHMSRGSGVPCIDYNSPIFSDSGQVVGGIIIGLSMNPLHEVVADKTGLGETGKIYIVNKDNYMITPSRFGEDVFLKQKVDTENFRNCFAMHEHGTEHDPQAAITISKDYRNIDILGTHAYISEMGWCMLGEIDIEEAFMPYSNLRNNLILISVILVVISLALSVLVSRSITNPIIRLKRAASEIGKGNLDTKIEIKSRDEVGELASAFSQMTEDLKGYRTQIRKHAEELEKRVVERTKELDTKVKELTNSKTAVLNMMEDMDEANKELVRTQEELKESLNELKEMDTKKDQFISIAAHELKTPLTSIHGFSQLLQNRKVANNFTKRSKYLKIMDHETKRLAKLVGDILDLSRIDLGTVKTSRDEVDVNAFVNNIKNEMDIQIEEKGLASEYEIEKDIPKIVTDKEKLTEVMINLIINAVKYTPEGNIKVKVSKDGENVHFMVKDTGIGIPKDQQEKIFDRFYQVDSSYTRKAGGTGLGLALCKEFVEILGGKLRVKSEEGKGTEFHFTLPVKGSSKEHMREGERKAMERLEESGKVRKSVKKMGFGNAK